MFIYLICFPFYFQKSKFVEKVSEEWNIKLAYQISMLSSYKYKFFLQALFYKYIVWISHKVSFLSWNCEFWLARNLLASKKKKKMQEINRCFLRHLGVVMMSIIIQCYHITKRYNAFYFLLIFNQYKGQESFIGWS